MLRFLPRVVLFCAVLIVGTARADDPSQLTIGGGLWDLVSHHTHEGEVLLDYRFGWGLFDGDGVFRGLKPFVAGVANTAGGFYGYGGLAAPFQFDNDKWEIEPSAGLGGYHRGDGLNLGGTFEFGLGVAASRAIGQNLRLGIDLTHISNANTHPKNPGMNSALMTLGWTFR
jgi:hypothetical protein